MKNRILEFLKAENKSSAQFADEIGVQPSSISHIISGRNNPSLDFILKMLTKYHSLSSDWLLFGKGQMYRDQQLNDLFGLETNKDSTTGSGLIGNDPNEDLHLPDNQPLTESVFSMKQKEHPGNNRTKRIVCFFDDDTFKEYNAADE
jgi:transcriptional regulator with XRE-family HTH domain